MPAAHYSMPLRVRYVECDMQGRVFNGHYLTWVDMAHTEALGAIVGDYRELVASGVDLVVAAAELQFRGPAEFDDRLQIHVRFRPPGITSLQTEFTIERDGTVLAECVMTHVCVETTDYRKRPWPDWIRARLALVS
jgi:acyl-CoA thioester hydrolase